MFWTVITFGDMPKIMLVSPSIKNPLIRCCYKILASLPAFIEILDHFVVTQFVPPISFSFSSLRPFL